MIKSRPLWGEAKPNTNYKQLPEPDIKLLYALKSDVIPILRIAMMRLRFCKTDWRRDCNEND